MSEERSGTRMITLPYSEVCMFMGVAGKRMLARLVDARSVQLYDEDGRPFGGAITRSEAGWDD